MTHSEPSTAIRTRGVSVARDAYAGSIDGPDFQHSF